jgi:hypothetical protein
MRICTPKERKIQNKKHVLVYHSPRSQKENAEMRNDKTVWDDAKPVVNLIHLSRSLSLVVNVIYLLLAAEASFAMSQIFILRVRFYATATTNGPSFPSLPTHDISTAYTFFR